MRFGVHFSGCGVAALYCLSSTYRLLVKEPPKMVLRRMMGPSLETGTVFDAVLSVNYCANCDSVSVRAVREKCDEKVARHLVSDSVTYYVSSSAGRFSKNAREVAHPSCFAQCSELKSRYTSQLNLSTRRTDSCFA